MAIAIPLNPSQPVSPLLSLPDECWDYILRHVRPQDLYQFSQCSQRTLRVVHLTLRTLWLQLQHEPPGDAAHRLVCSGKRMRRLFAQASADAISNGKSPDAVNYFALFKKLFQEIHADTQSTRSLYPEVRDWRYNLGEVTVDQFPATMNSPPTRAQFQTVLEKIRQRTVTGPIHILDPRSLTFKDVAETPSLLWQGLSSQGLIGPRGPVMGDGIVQRRTERILQQLLLSAQPAIPSAMCAHALTHIVTSPDKGCSTNDLADVHTLSMYCSMTEEDRSQAVLPLLESSPLKFDNWMAYMSALIFDGPISEDARRQVIFKICTLASRQVPCLPFQNEAHTQKISLSPQQYSLLRHLCQERPLTHELRNDIISQIWCHLDRSEFALDMMLQLLFTPPPDAKAAPYLPCTTDIREQAVMAAASVIRNPDHRLPVMRLLLPPATPITPFALEQALLIAISNWAPEIIDFLMQVYPEQITPAIRSSALCQAVLACRNILPEHIDPRVSLIRLLLRSDLPPLENRNAYAQAICHAMDFAGQYPQMLELLLTHDHILDGNDYGRLLPAAIHHYSEQAGILPRVLERVRERKLHLSDDALNAACVAAVRLSDRDIPHAAPAIIQLLLENAGRCFMSEEPSDAIINQTWNIYPDTAIHIMCLFFQYHVPISNGSQALLEIWVIQNQSDHPILAQRLQEQLDAYRIQQARIAGDPCTIS